LAKQSQFDRALVNLDAQIAVLQSARQILVAAAVAEPSVVPRKRGRPAKAAKGAEKEM